MFRSTDLGAAIPTKDTVLEPSASNNQNVVFYTTNWSAAVSTDSGASFTYINPFTDLPSAAAGLCCDQVTIYDPHYDITVWELQYLNDANGDVQRLAVANGRAGVASNSWHYWDITAQMFGFPTGDWLDFPRLALSTNYLYLSTNVFTSANSSITTALFRMPLSALSSPTSTPTGVVVNDPAVDVFEPVSGATDTMYFGAHFSPTDFRVYRWPEAAGSPQLADVTHPAFNYENGDGLCPSPDTFNMCGRSDSRVAAGWLSAGTLGFFWAAKQGVVGTQTFPYPYVQGIRIDAATAAHVDDPQVFSSSYAYQYPDVAANAAGHLGLSIVYGGGPTTYPSSAIGILDDFSPSAFSLLAVRSGDHGPSNNSWGDYLTVRPASGNGLTWVGTSYTLQGGSAGSSVEPRFLWFGRLRDDPFAPSASSHDFNAVAGTSTGSVVTANFTGPSAHAADYSATIDWGDGSAIGPGTVAGTGQAFNVTGSHTYSTTGSFTVTTAVSDAFASTSTVKGAATVTATQAANDVKVSANPASISADGASTSTVKAIVTKHVGSTPVAGDTVNFALSGAACGSLGAPSATTNASGNASVTYTSSTTTGLCTVTATETNAGGSGGTIVTQTRAGGTYHPLAPFRILDTRPGSQVGPYSSPFGADTAREIQVGGFPGSHVPASGVSAVVLNVTVTNTTAPSYLTIYPDGAARPFASNLNWTGGVTIPNLVEVAVGPSSTSAPGYISVYNQRGNADVVIDVQGFVTDPASSPGPDGLFNPLAPARILDTRPTPLGPNSILSLSVPGAGGVPGSGVEAVVLNVTVTNPTAASYLTIWPEGQSQPTASNLNFLPNQTIPNRVIVQLGSGGKVDIFNKNGSVNVVADVGGWYTDTTAGGTGLRFQAVTPYRILDTRPTPIQADSSIPVQVTGTIGAGTTPSSARAVVINVTATDTSAGSYLTVWPDGTAKPPSSDLNWPPGVTIANLVVIKLGSGGKVDAYNQLGTTNVVVDLVGFYI